MKNNRLVRRGVAVGATLGGAVLSVFLFVSDAVAQTTVTVPTVNEYDPTAGMLGVINPYIPIIIGLVLAVFAVTLGPRIATWGMGFVTGIFRKKKPSV